MAGVEPTCLISVNTFQERPVEVLHCAALPKSAEMPLSLLHRSWWAGVVSIHSPEGTSFTDSLTKPSSFPALNMEPPLRIKLRSARYQRAALSLCYGGMAERQVIETYTSRCAGISNPAPTPIGLHAP